MEEKITPQAPVVLEASKYLIRFQKMKIQCFGCYTKPPVGGSKKTFCLHFAIKRKRRR